MTVKVVAGAGELKIEVDGKVLCHTSLDTDDKLIPNIVTELQLIDSEINDRSADREEERLP